MCSSCDPGELLSLAGLKATAQRLRVLKAVSASGEALTAQALLASLRREAPMDKVTLYRVLEALGQAGLVTRHEAGDATVRYCCAGPAHPGHHHFYCLDCKRLLCLEPGAVTVGADVPGVRQVSVRLDGTCRQCAAKSHPPDFR